MQQAVRKSLMFTFPTKFLQLDSQNQKQKQLKKAWNLTTRFLVAPEELM